MKTVTIDEAQARFPNLIRVVEAGEEIKIIRKKKPVARIVPMKPKVNKVHWSDTWARVDEIFGGKTAPGKPGSRIVIEGRR